MSGWHNICTALVQVIFLAVVAAGRGVDVRELVVATTPDRQENLE